MSKPRKRIGIEVQRLFRPKKHGMEVVALELIKELQEIDTKHEYVLFVKKDNDRCLTESTGFKIEELASLPYPLWEQVSLPLAIRKSRLDILHSTCNTSVLFPSVPLVLTLHDIIYLEQLDMAGTWYQNFGNMYRRLIVPSLVKKAGAIITVSEFEKQVMVERLNIRPEKVRVIHNAVNTRFNARYGSLEVEAFRRSRALPPDFLLFLGNTAPKKNTKNTLEAYIKYASATESPLPMVVLDYPKVLVIEQLRKLGSEHLIENFVFPGYIRPSDMPLMYNSATVFIYPSLRESFGLPILEAMACGVPVITSDTSSMPEVAGDAAVLIDPFDPSGMAEAMGNVLGNPGMRNEMVAKGIQRAELFSWKNAAHKLLEVYETL